MSKFPTIDGVIIINANYILGIDISGLAEGGIWFSGADGSPSVDASNLFWDDINKRLGMGTINPSEKLNVVGNLLIEENDLPQITIRANDDGAVANAATLCLNRNSKAKGFNGILFKTGSVNDMLINTPSGTADIRLFDYSINSPTGAETMRWQQGGNVGINLTNPQEKLSIDGIINVPKASTNGIKVDLTTPTFGFADIIGDQFSKNTGATKPTLATYNGAINAWQFGAGDEAYMSFHIPHDYVKGSPIFLHVHWSHIATTVTGGTLTFKATSILSKGHNQQPFQSTPSVGTFTGTASTVQYQQILSEVLYSDGTPTGLQIDTDNLEPDSVIEMTFELDANNITVSGGGVPDPFIHFVDIHYQTTSIIGTKDKVPDFYI